MAPRPAPSSLSALLLLVAICALLAISGAAAARPPPSSSPSPSAAPTPASCLSQCAAALSACRSSLKARQQDAAAIKAISQAYGCAVSSSSSDHCKDFSVVLLDLFAYASSGYNKDGVKEERVVAWTADDRGARTPCAACAGTRDVCQSIAETCQPFCLNDRRPQAKWQVLGGMTPDLGGVVSELPREAGSEILYNRAVLTTVSAQTNQLGIGASYVAYTSRRPNTRASVHFHTSAVVSCVIEGCNQITLADAQGGAAEPATFCARDDGTPTCYLMPAFTKLLNVCVGDKPVRMLDVFSIKPDESYFHSLEPLGAKETRQGAGLAGGVAVTTVAAAAPAEKQEVAGGN